MTHSNRLLADATLNPKATPLEVAAFEERYGLVLPPDYRSFILDVGNGGSVGPEYGLLPLAVIPPYWASLHDYADSLQRSFELHSEWVWEDEPEHPTLAARVSSATHGVILLGEEGCGARWVLVVRGTTPGAVWFASGEGTTPAAPTFTAWMDSLLGHGFSWWSEFPARWGPQPGIWFAAHAIKQALVSHLNRVGRLPARLSQSSPLCKDCQQFLTRAALYHRTSFSVAVPGGAWQFLIDGVSRYTSERGAA